LEAAGVEGNGEVLTRKSEIPKMRLLRRRENREQEFS
jgi:hypothetical protein